MNARFPASRAVGIALIALSFAIGAVESGLFLRADDAVPLWDKAIHALCALGIVLAVAPQGLSARNAVAIALGAGLVWEVVQFAIDPFQKHTPLIYAIDTLTDLAADVAGGLIALRWPGGRPRHRETAAGPQLSSVLAPQPAPSPHFPEDA